MKFKRINLLLITALLVLVGLLATNVQADDQEPIKVQDHHQSAGLPQDISPEQLESLQTEKYTFQVRLFTIKTQIFLTRFSVTKNPFYSTRLKYHV
jgi:hypothetical protein